jgi:hypothetical protein
VDDACDRDTREDRLFVGLGGFLYRNQHRGNFVDGDCARERDCEAPKVLVFHW